MKIFRLNVSLLICATFFSLCALTQKQFEKGDILILSYVSLFPHDFSASIGFLLTPDYAEKTGFPCLIGLKAEPVQERLSVTLDVNVVSHGFYLAEKTIRRIDHSNGILYEDL